jgi:hypothetical protein
MGRVGKYMLVGGFLAVLVLAVYAAIDGYLYGAGANRQHPSGFDGMVTGVVIWLGFFGPMVGIIGVFTGMVAAMAGQAVDRMCAR